VKESSGLVLPIDLEELNKEGEKEIPAYSTECKRG